MLRIAMLLLAVFYLTACQTPPDIQVLKNENTNLQQQLEAAQQNIVQLKAEQARLNQQQDELNRVIGILGQEKTSRVEESTALRGQVRGFVQAQIDGLKQFMLNSNLVDYIGSAQVERSQNHEEPLLLVDLANTVPNDGTLTGVGALFNKPGVLTVKVLRLVEGKLVVIWESLPVKVKAAGLQRLNFTVSVGVQRGDVLAYYLSEPGLVSFDTGTGDSRYLKEDVHFGHSFKLSSLRGEDKKAAYSIGVYGLLNAQ